jgi:hypothetical protein
MVRDNVVELEDRDPILNFSCVIYITREGSLRVTKNLRDIKEGEIAIEAQLNLHKDLWESTFVRTEIYVGEDEAQGVEVPAISTLKGKGGPKT